MKLNCRLLRVMVGVLACACFFGASLPSWGQQNAGSITGMVTDASGAAIPNAVVTVHSVSRGTSWTTKTSGAGVFDFPSVTVGEVEVKASATGFATQVRSAFALQINQVARVNFKLAVGNVSQVVTVTAAPPLLQTDSTELGTVISGHAATALPLATRNINQLTLLVPGVVSPNIFAFQSPQTTFGTGRPYVNGAREQDNNFSLDGMDTNQADNNEVAYVPSPDAIAEFKIITGNAPADYGNYIGGVIVETLKSGTNQYHGNIYEFLRNTALNANSWQNNTTGAPRNPLQWNNFGGTIGGPILKNKLFFFADEQNSLYNTPANTVTYAPIPAAFRTGDFSSICTAGFTNGLCNDATEQLYDPASSNTPATRTPFLNNQVPVRSKVAAAIMALPNFPSATTDTYLQHSYVHSYQGDIKIDWQASQNDHIMGRYSQQYTINQQSNSISLLPSQTREYPLKNFVIDYVRTVSPSLVNDVRFGMQIFPANDQIFTNPTGENLPQKVGLPGVQDTILPSMNFGGTYSSIGNADLVEVFHDTTIQAEDALTWTHGRHVIHGGFEYYHYIMNDLYPGNQGLAGTFTFDGQFTGNNGISGPNSIADFLLGLPVDVQIGTPLHFHLRNSLIGAFIQDNWRATNTLTLNLGLRYELTTPRGDKDAINNVNFDKVTGTPQIGTNYDTYTGIDNFQPRFGFAWQFHPNAVVRGAYGISTYMEGNGVNNMAVVNPPYIVAREVINSGLAHPETTLDQGYSAFPAAACTAAALEAFSPDCLSAGVTVHETNPKLQPAVDQQWNLMVQQQFGHHATISVGYVGNKIDHMTDLFLWNQLQINPQGTLIPGPFSQKLVATGASVRYNDSSAISRYNALELMAAERNFHDLNLQAAYTWSKCLSNSLGYFGQYGDEEGTGQSQTMGGYFFFQNDYDPMGDYGRCISNAAGVFNGYVVYALPFGRGKRFGSNVNRAVDAAVGGWSVASDFNFHTGFAINPSAPDQSGTGGGADFAYRPNCVSGVSQRGSGALENLGGNIGLQFLNPAAVTMPAKGTFGDCQVGAFTGPGLKTADINLTKQFHITERVHLKFETQFLNFTNTPIFGAPNSSCGPECDGVIDPSGTTHAGTFGLVQSQDPGRQIQFALKLSY